MCLRFLDHAVNIFLAHAAVRLNGDLLLFACAKILCRDVHDTICIDIKGNFNAWNTARCRRDIGEFEAAERLIARSHLTLTLQNMNIDRWLIIRCRREDLALMCRNRRIALNELRANAAERLDAEGKRRNVEEKNVLDFTDKDTALDGSTDGDALIRVDALRRLLIEDGADSLLNGRNAGRTANEDDLIDIAARQVGIRHRLLGRLHRALDEVTRHLVKLCA